MRSSVAGPSDSIVIMDWTSFGRVRTAMTVRDYDIVMLALAFDEGIEEPTTDSFDWIRKLRSQPGFPEMIILAEGGSELAAIRTLRLGAADYLPKRLLHAAAPAALHQAHAARHREGSAAPRRTQAQPPRTKIAGRQARRSRQRSRRPSTPAALSHISTHTGAQPLRRRPRSVVVATETRAALPSRAAPWRIADARTSPRTPARSLRQAAKAALRRVHTPTAR